MSDHTSQTNTKPSIGIGPAICHFPAGDRCRDCRTGAVHYHQWNGPKVLFVNGRRDPDPVATLITIGVHPEGFRPVTFGDLREQARTRCDCCDGPDGRGYHHIVGGLDALHTAVLDGTVPDGPISVEDHQGRLVVELDSLDDARGLLSDLACG